MSSIQEDVISGVPTYRAISRCLDDQNFLMLGRINSAAYSNMIGDPRYIRIKKNRELAKFHPEYPYINVYQRLRQRYSQGLQGGFSDPYTLYDEFTPVVFGALNCMNTLNDVANQFCETHMGREKVIRGLQKLKQPLRWILPGIILQFESCANELRTIDRSPLGDEVIESLNHLLALCVALSPDEKFVLQGLCVRAQSSVFSDLYELIEAVEKQFLLLNEPEKPILSLYQGGYVGYKQEINALLRKGQQLSLALKYEIPIFALVLLFVFYTIANKGPCTTEFNCRMLLIRDIAISCLVALGFTRGKAMIIAKRRAVVTSLDQLEEAPPQPEQPAPTQ